MLAYGILYGSGAIKTSTGLQLESDARFAHDDIKQHAKLCDEESLIPEPSAYRKFVETTRLHGEVEHEAKWDSTKMHAASIH